MLKCPLLHHKEHNTDVFPGEVFEDCLKEECAGWDEGKLCCGERTKRLQLERIADTLKVIANKMPHAGQFLK